MLCRYCCRGGGNGLRHARGLRCGRRDFNIGFRFDRGWHRRCSRFGRDLNRALRYIGRYRVSGQWWRGQRQLRVCVARDTLHESLWHSDCGGADRGCGGYLPSCLNGSPLARRLGGRHQTGEGRLHRQGRRIARLLCGQGKPQHICHPFGGSIVTTQQNRLTIGAEGEGRHRSTCLANCDGSHQRGEPFRHGAGALAGFHASLPGHQCG